MLGPRTLTLKAPARGRLTRSCALAVAAVVVMLTGQLPAVAAGDPAPATGSWEPAASPRHPGVGLVVQGALLPTGRVLLVEQAAREGGAEIYDPSAGPGGGWTETAAPGALGQPRRALVLRGSPGECGTGCGTVLVRIGAIGQRAEWRVFDPVHPVSPWAATSPPLYTRGFGATATLLTGSADVCGRNCGRVLVVGGLADFGPLGAAQNRPSPLTAELYDPLTNAWAPTGQLSPGRAFHAAALLDGPRCGHYCGKVLVVGGGRGCQLTYQPCSGAEGSATVYDPRTGVWTGVPAPSFPHLDGGGATRLADGRVLITDASPGSGPEVFDPLASAGAGAWMPTKGRCVCFGLHATALLPDGRVLVVGGPSSTATDLYDPASNSWIAGPTFPGVSAGNSEYPNVTAILLEGPNCGANCGKVLVTGGGQAHLFIPPGYVAPGGALSQGMAVRADASRLPWLLAAGGAVTVAVAAGAALLIRSRSRRRVRLPLR